VTQRSIETLERRTIAGRGARLLAVTTVTALAFAGLSAAPAAYAAGETGTVSGTVKLGNETDPQGANVYLYTSYGTGAQTQIGTAAVVGGQYTIADVPVGNYTAVVQAQNVERLANEVWGAAHGPYHAPGVVTVTAGGTFDADFDYLWTIRARFNPSMADTTTVDATLVYTPQTWWTTGLTETFQWLKDEEAIPGANTTSLVVLPEYLGSTLRMVQTVEKAPNYYPRTNNFESAYVDGPYLEGGTGTLPDVIHVGDTITPTITSGWTPEATSYTYEWFTHVGDQSDEWFSTAKSLKVTPDLLGKQLAVRITGHKPGYFSASVSVLSNVNVVAAVVIPKLVAAAPAVSGTLKQGATLTAKAAAWNTTGVATTYQWFEERAGKELAIEGATASKYKIQPTTAGAKLSVKVTGKKTGYTSLTKESSVTKAVPFLKLTLSKAPKLSGKFKVGKTVKVTIGKFSQKGVQVSYVWKVNGKKFAETAKPSLKLTKALKGKKITVTSYGKKVGYTEVSKTSKKSKKVK